MDLRAIIKKDFAPNNYINSAIFAGPNGSGKLSTALDISYNLASYSDNIMLFTTRNILVLLKNAYDNFIKSVDKESVQYFLRAVDIAFLRLSSSQDKIKIDKNKRDEILSSIDYIRLCKNCDNSVIDKVKDIYELLHSYKYSQTISVDDIRTANQFLHSTSPFSCVKVLILENIETMNKAVSNSLLKLLEEPPRDSVILILSQSPKSLLKTITSRSRIYNFSQKSDEHIAKSSEFQELKSVSVLFVKSLIEQKRSIELIKALNAAFDRKKSELSAKEKSEIFLERCAYNIQQCYKEGAIDEKKAKIIFSKLNAIKKDILIFNQSIINALDSVFLHLL